MRRQFSSIAMLSDMAHLLFTNESLINEKTSAKFYADFISLLYDFKTHLKDRHQHATTSLAARVDSLIANARHHGLENYFIDFLLHTKEDLKYNSDVNTLDLESISVSERAFRIPGMIEMETMQYYKWLGKNLRGFGDVVQLGVWLGRSTFCIAEGISENPKCASSMIYAVDNFVWEDWMNKFTDLTDQFVLPAGGEDYRPLFEKNCRSHIKQIEMLMINFNEQNSSGKFIQKQRTLNGSRLKKIELFVYDMGSDLQKISEAWSIFSKYFIPGKTIIVLQEYCKLRSEALRHFVRYNKLHALHAPVGTSRSFILKKT
jgi:hypothetical protein